MSLLATILGQFLILGAVFVSLTAAELAWPMERQGVKSRLQGAVFWIMVASFEASCVLAFSVAVRRLHLQPAWVMDLERLPGAVVTAPLLAAIFGDFFFYWMHRAQHRWFWKFHAVHHSIREMNALSSYHHLSEPLFRLLFLTLPGSFVVFNVPSALMLTILVVAQGMFLHSSTRLNLGPLRWLIGDNRFHRIHHSADPVDFDRNFSGFSPLWDIVFGTARFPRKDEWAAIGLSAAPEPASVTDYVCRPFKQRS